MPPPSFYSLSQILPSWQSEDEGGCGFTACAGWDATTPLRRLFHAPMRPAQSQSPTADMLSVLRCLGIQMFVGSCVHPFVWYSQSIKPQRPSSALDKPSSSPTVSQPASQPLGFAVYNVSNLAIQYHRNCLSSSGSANFVCASAHPHDNNNPRDK